jgi:hypothetical protein
MRQSIAHLVHIRVIYFFFHFIKDYELSKKSTTTIQSTAERFNNLHMVHIWEQYNLLSKVIILLSYMYHMQSSVTV